MNIEIERKDNLLGEKKYTAFDLDISRMEGFTEGQQQARGEILKFISSKINSNIKKSVEEYLREN